MTAARQNKTSESTGRREDGNAFVIVLIGIVLFAALMFTFTRSARQGGDNLGDRQVTLLASDITEYAQGLERAVSRTMLNGISENQLSFANGQVAGYDNAGDCGSDKCRVFTSAGGGAAWQNPPANANDGSAWVVAGTNAVPGVGNDVNADLLLLLPNITHALCLKIDTQLGVALVNDDVPGTTGIDTTQFTGTFADTARIGDAATLGGIHAACVKTGSHYYFYEVLLER